MKYTLNENIKFFLNEKYLLDERFILSEDANTITKELNSLRMILTNYVKFNAEDKLSSDDTKNIATIRQELSALNTTLASYNKTSLNLFDKAINKLSGQALKSSDAAQIKGLTKEVIQRVEKLLEASSIANEKVDAGTTGTAASVKDYLRQIKQLAASNDTSKETLLKIKENVAKITETINKLSQNKTQNSTSLKDIVEISQNALMNVYNLQNFITKVGGKDKFAALDDADKLMALVTTIITDHTAGKTALEQRQNLIDFSNLTTKIIDASGITLDTDRTKTIDWDSRFTQAKDKRTFWSSYYEKAWGSNASRIRGLGDPFRNQCEKLGFSSRTNPFINFVKKYVIEKNYPIGIAAYTAIHNAVANGNLDQALLNGTAGDKINILACKDLYTKSAAEISNYLTVFNTVYESARLDPNILFSIDIDDITDTTRKAKFAAVLSHLNRDNKSRNQIAWLLLFNTISFTDNILLKNDSRVKLNPSYSPSTLETISLRKFVEIQAIIKILAPEVTTISNKAFTNSTLQALAAKMPAAKIAKTTEIGQWILVMIGQFLSPEDEEEILRTYPKLSSIALSPTDRVKIKKKILDFGNSMTKAQLIAILTAYENGSSDGGDDISFK